ncbi:cytochrome-c oxidase [Gluconacetobacter azotocaptans]|uniref:Cytochrome-c oxidase n=1 Tax=Gluconacetobacter azotocaptans TaxID=142834 RepID=A0A7W4JRV8_9PROT|nr:cbb3-type cytochrome c oxidase subunit I [Gluconacetobacter azotocaptans]MBB2189745.1 cytochrome-c oxidase [Gluconacetobacter azotocaptans]GBQ29883.1 cytochrome c oxidase subunit 1 [Gluconacetobacter azotocaptans DSM 13594]
MPTEGQVRMEIGTGGFLARCVRASGHKDIGTLYLALAVLAGLVGGGLALMLQLGQARPMSGPWDRVAIDHGAMMVMFCALPALVGGFGSWFVPLLLGAPSMAFPRLNLLCWAGVTASFLMLLSGVPSGAGSSLPQWATLLWCAAMLGLSINMVATVLNMRRAGLSLSGMPLFVWAQALTAMMMVIVLPVLAAALTKGLLSGAGLRDVDLALRAFSGPEVALLLLPASGIVCQVIETFSGVPLRLRWVALGAMAVMSVGGATVWTHDMFAAGLAAAAGTRPMVEQAAVMVPMLALLMAWGSTIAGGRLALRVPMLWACAFVGLLVVGPVLSALSGAADGHAVALPAALFATFAGFYYWIGKMSGHACPEAGGRLHIALAATGTLLCLVPHQPVFALLGAALLGLSMLTFVAVVVVTLRRGTQAMGGNYWGAGARTLEWSLPSPAPRHSFTDFPAYEVRA